MLHRCSGCAISTIMWACIGGKICPAHIRKILCKYFIDIGLKDVKAAANAAYAEYKAYLTKVRAKGEEYLALAKEKDLPVILLAGRPYHLDPEINHGIDTLICDLGAVVISEDAVSHLTEKFPTKVLNQWTYHARLYAAAKLVGEWNGCQNQFGTAGVIRLWCGCNHHR